MDRKNSYESSSPDNASFSSSSSRAPSTPFADVKDVVTADDAAPPPYTRYAEEPRSQPRRPQQSQPQHSQQNDAYQSAPRDYNNTQYQEVTQQAYSMPRYQPRPPREYQSGPQQTYYSPQSEAASAAQAASRRQTQPQARYQMYDQQQGCNQPFGGRGGLRSGGPLRMILDSRQQNSQPSYGRQDMDYGRTRRGRERHGGGGPLHLLMNEAMKRL